MTDPIRSTPHDRPRGGFDLKCRDLAEYFLSDIPGAGLTVTEELAQAIQDTIEDFLKERGL